MPEARVDKNRILSGRALVDPALAGTFLSQECAVSVEQKNVRVTSRCDRAERDASHSVVDIEAGDALPGQRADAARVPARDLRLAGGRFLRRCRDGSKKEQEAGQGHGE